MTPNKSCELSEEELMKEAVCKSIARTALVVLALAGLPPTAAWARGDDDRPDKIVGVWDVAVTVRSCVNGAALFTFPALHKYELGGTGQVVPATNPAALSPHVTVWKRVGKNLYQMSVKMFRFDASGNNIGWAVIRNDVAINEDGSGYAGSGRAETFDASGNSLGTSCPTFVGTRF
jgi:hypothetical protein